MCCSVVGQHAFCWGSENKKDDGDWFDCPNQTKGPMAHR